MKVGETRNRHDLELQNMRRQVNIQTYIYLHYNTWINNENVLFLFNMKRLVHNTRTYSNREYIYLYICIPVLYLYNMRRLVHNTLTYSNREYINLYICIYTKLE